MKSFALVFALFSSLAYGGSNCGSAGSPINKYIPDSLNAGVICSLGTGTLDVSGMSSADFSRSCSRHDRCYWTLGSNRGTCDSDFRSELIEECRRTYNTVIESLGKGCCMAFAEAYALAVRSGGQESYENGQIDADKVLSNLHSKLGLESSSILRESTAKLCSHNFKDENCDTDTVESIYTEHYSKLATRFQRYLARPITTEEANHYFNILLSHDFSETAVDQSIFSEKSREIVISKSRNELAIELDEGQINHFESSLKGLGFDYFEAELYVAYAKQAISHIYRTTHNKEISPLWAVYYEQLLVRTRDIDSVREKIKNNKR